MPNLATRADKRAHRVLEATYSHLSVFTLTVSAWPPELRVQLPPFAELYVDPPGKDRSPGPVTAMEQRLRHSPGPIKLLLTGQKGAGKSWAIEHLGEVLSDKYVVVRVSATDASGATLAEAEVSDVMVLLCEAITQKVTGWDQLEAMDEVVARWAARFEEQRGLPAPPTRTAHFDVEIRAFWARFASRMRSSGEVRELVRKVGADDLVVVANAMLDTVARERPTLVLFDDLDKVKPEFSRRLFGEQFSVIGRITSKMVLTFPYSLNFENVIGQPREVLLNVQVKADRHAERVRPEALVRFGTLLGKLVVLDLIEGLAIEAAVENSGGIPREFGRIVAKAFEHAALLGDERVERSHAEDAIRDLRIELLMATQDGKRRQSLMRVRRSRQLEDDLDRRLVDEDLVVQYINGKPWFDVHPLIASDVDDWIRAEPAPVAAHPGASAAGEASPPVRATRG